MKKKDVILKLKNVGKFYYNKGLVSSGFNKVSLDFSVGEFVVITGESGSGKSTLLNVISGLDSYEEGEMYINGNETSHYLDADFENYRKTYVSNIFQSFNLVSSYTVYQNVELVLLLNGYKVKDIKNKVLDLIDKVDLTKYKNTKVSKLSGGQKQRVAIARALAKETPIIVADEPTGNLDVASASKVLKVLSEVAKEKLVVVVTHNYEQVEKYATRKITMHDGSVREDLNLKEYTSSDPVLKTYGNITLLNNIRLGIRNTFSIVPKFLLTFAVFLFVVMAFLGEYSSFKKFEQQENTLGYNDFFRNISLTRIVLNKKDKSAFTDSEIAAIKALNNVSDVELNDLTLDTTYSFQSENVYFYGGVASVKKISKVDVGRLPQNDNEVVIKGYKDDYYISSGLEELENDNFNLMSDYGFSINEVPLKIVGIIYENSYGNATFYVGDAILNKVNKNVNIFYSDLTYTLGDKTFDAGNYSVNLVKSPLVNKGEVLYSYGFNEQCAYSWCKGKEITFTVKNIYYEDSITLVMNNYYTKYTHKNLSGYDNYDEYAMTMYISEEDYDYLYNKDTYQISVFTTNAKHVNSVNDTLKSMGYNTLVMKDAINNSESITGVIRIFKWIVTIVLFVVLFFITYFVIKLIQKSKNIYYATVRILGASKTVINKFIQIELLTVFNLSYILFLVLILLVKVDIISASYLKDLSIFLELKDYIIIYVILTIMSLLIANRYAKKLFKSSAMKTYREEV